MSQLVRNRSGLTLVELLVALVIATMSGAALIQAMLAQSRSAGSNEAWRVARSVSRGALNRLIADVRVAEAEGALEAATADGRSITLRVPYAMGVACTVTPPIDVSLLPVDAAVWSTTSYEGFAWRGDQGRYAYRAATAPGPQPPAGTPANCLPDSIATVPGGSVRLLSPSGGLGSFVIPGSPYPGMVILLSQRIRYRFEPSSVPALAGRLALTREIVTTGAKEELAAPFDSTARFRYIVQGSHYAQNAVPSPLSITRGLEIRLDGMSETIPNGSTTQKRMTMSTAIYFKNTRD